MQAFGKQPADLGNISSICHSTTWFTRVEPSASVVLSFLTLAAGACSSSSSAGPAGRFAWSVRKGPFFTREVPSPAPPPSRRTNNATVATATSTTASRNALPAHPLIPSPIISTRQPDRAEGQGKSAGKSAGLVQVLT
jgi:hypothetical protein